jgi:hypothetical protein
VIPTFHFRSAIQTDIPKELLLEMDNNAVSYLIMDNEMNCLELASFHLQHGHADRKLSDALKEIITSQSITDHNYRKVNVIFSFPDAELIPDEFMTRTSARALLELVHGSIATDEIKAEPVHKQSLHVVYAVKADVEKTVNEIFPNVNISHLHTQLAGINSGETACRMICIFNTSSFVTALTIDNNIQIVKHFKYNNPEDVSYSLLNICKNYSVDPQQILLQFYGMIDDSSNLYKELYKYFTNIELSSLPGGVQLPEAMKEHPSHYFAHLFLLASCV